MHTLEQCQSLNMSELRLEIDERLDILEAGPDRSDDLYESTVKVVNLYMDKTLQRIQHIHNKISPVQSEHICGPDCRIHRS